MGEDGVSQSLAYCSKRCADEEDARTLRHIDIEPSEGEASLSVDSLGLHILRCTSAHGQFSQRLLMSSSSLNAP